MTFTCRWPSRCRPARGHPVAPPQSHQEPPHPAAPFPLEVARRGLGNLGRAGALASRAQV